MATQPDRIREEIETTRSELVEDVNRLADRTSPKRIAERRWDGMKSTLRRTTDKVMGASQQAGGSMHSGMGGVQDKTKDAAHTVADRTQSAGQTIAGKASDAADRTQQAASGIAGAARQAPATVARQAQGNPIAVGLIAFGAGLLVASLLPETDAERRVGGQLADQADKVVEPLKETAQQMGGELKDKALDAADDLKGSAQQAVANTKDQAAESGRAAATETKESVSSPR